MTQSNHDTPANKTQSESLPIMEKFGYGVGGSLDLTVMPMVQMFSYAVFVMWHNVSPAFLGAVFMFQRVWVL